MKLSRDVINPQIGFQNGFCNGFIRILYSYISLKGQIKDSNIHKVYCRFICAFNYQTKNEYLQIKILAFN